MLIYFIRFLKDIVEELIMKRECIVIDFNIDFIVDFFDTKYLQTTMLNMGIKQYVNKPTRITKDSRTITDLIFLIKNRSMYNL